MEMSSELEAIMKRRRRKADGDVPSSGSPRKNTHNNKSDNSAVTKEQDESLSKPSSSRYTKPAAQDLAPPSAVMSNRMNKILSAPPPPPPPGPPPPSHHRHHSSSSYHTRSKWNNATTSSSSSSSPRTSRPITSKWKKPGESLKVDTSVGAATTSLSSSSPTSSFASPLYPTPKEASDYYDKKTTATTTTTAFTKTVVDESSSPTPPQPTSRQEEEEEEGSSSSSSEEEPTPPKEEDSYSSEEEEEEEEEEITKEKEEEVNLETAFGENAFATSFTLQNPTELQPTTTTTDDFFQSGGGGGDNFASWGVENPATTTTTTTTSGGGENTNAFADFGFSDAFGNTETHIEEKDVVEYEPPPPQIGEDVYYEPPPSFALDMVLSKEEEEEGGEESEEEEEDVIDLSGLEKRRYEVKFRSQRLSPSHSSSDTTSSSSPPSPVLNPLTGNVILTRPTSNTIYLEEINFLTQTTTISIPIFSPSLQRKISSQYNVSTLSIKNVVNVAAGVHEQQQSNKSTRRVRVAAVVDVLVMKSPPASSSSSSNNNALCETFTLRLLAVYQWGYASTMNVSGDGSSSPLAALQSIIRMPLENKEYDGSLSSTTTSTIIKKGALYEVSTLCIADGLVFFGGTLNKSLKTPCVYLAKPHVRDAWGVAFVGGGGDGGGRARTVRVTALAVTSQLNRSDKYLAVGLNVGTISVWSYEAAVAINKFGAGEGVETSSTKLMEPVCRLEGAPVFETLEETLLVPEDEEDESTKSENGGGNDDDEDGKKKTERVENKGTIPSYCTHLAWTPPCSSTSSLLLLAAAFTNGVAVYHVRLPVLVDLSPPTAESVSELSATSDDPASTPRHGRSISSAQKATSIQKKTSVPTRLSQTVILPPLAAAKASQEGILSDDPTPCRTLVSWLNLGPRCPPCLTLLFESTVDTMKRCQIVLGAVDLPLYGSAMATKGFQQRSILALCNDSFLSSSTSRADLVGVDAMAAVLCHHNGELTSFSPFLASKTTLTSSLPKPSSQSQNLTISDDAYFSSLLRPVASTAPGLDSDGIVSCADVGDGPACDNVLHVFSLMECRRMGLAELSSPKPNTERIDWTAPVQRHWLCLTTMGDRKDGKAADVAGGASRTGEVGTHGSDSQSLSQFGDGEDYVTGGADTSVICELTCGESDSSALTPARIVRQRGGRRCAVLFASSWGGVGGDGTNDTNDKIIKRAAEPSPDPVAFTILDTCISKNKKQTTFSLQHGRDVVMLPPTEDGTENIIVLDSDGFTISEFTRATIKDEESETETVEWKKGCTVPIFKGFSSVDEVIEGKRIFALYTGQIRLLVVGTRRDGRTCIFFSNCLTETLQKAESFTTLTQILPGKKSSVMSDKEELPELSLREGEEVSSLVELPPWKPDEQALIALATQSRVMIISAVTAEIVSETSTKCSSIAPMGSHSVSYCSASSATGGGLAKIRYLSCLKGNFSSGVIATLPNPRCGYARYLLLAVRPDRLIYLSSQCGSRLVEHGESHSKILSPIPSTRPAFLLEPMVANALCLDNCKGQNAASSDTVQTTLRTVIERFGRKVASFPHGDTEGIGCLGTGLTEKSYRLLKRYSCEQAASFLLTGNSPRHKRAGCKVLPPWIPMCLKASTATNCDQALQVLSSDDQYLADYTTSPENAMPCSLPRTTDPTTTLSNQLAVNAMQEGNVSDALRFLDLSGSETSESMLIQIVLSLQLNAGANIEKSLGGIVGGGKGSFSGENATNFNSSSASIAALALDLKRRQVDGKVPLEAGECGKIDDEVSKHWARQLAPSVQRGRGMSRSRGRLVDSDAFKIAASEEKYPDEAWRIPPDESEHVWSMGPFGEKEELLSLDRFEEWLGRRRPAILGKAGAAIAAESGEKTLADILAAANSNDSEEGKSLDGESDDSNKGGWVSGIGEGRSDEDNLSAYFRFSEGADEDCNWRADGVIDISKHQHKAIIYGSEVTNLEATSSNVDEGVGGKVKLLYDLVFNERIDRDRTAGLIVEAVRGSSLDVGMLHGNEHESRKRCTVEMWYRLPSAELVTDEIILMRRSLSDSDDEDITKLCQADNKSNLIWELVVLPSGRLELRTSGGSILNSSQMSDTNDTTENQPVGDGNSTDSDSEQEKDNGMVFWERPDGGGGWNHVCIIFSSRSQSALTDCSTKLMMQGVTVASDVVSVQLQQEGRQLSNLNEVNEALAKSVILLGLGSVPGFRMTEVRIWSCERAEDDVKMMMYEYLSAAEIKKKFKVKINNNKGGIKKIGGSLLAPPTENKRRVVPMPNSKNKTDSEAFQFEASFDNINRKEETKGDNAGTKPQSKLDEKSDAFDSKIEERIPFGQSMFTSEEGRKNVGNTFAAPFPTNVDIGVGIMKDFAAKSRACSLTLELSDLLSKQVRNSAAAAIIRGPPATRHFGGNRGGLAKPSTPNYGNRTRGVGAIAICGQEKTVLYTHGKSPPGKTLPIGASGAIISDIMDSQCSEYLCCFLAKEKRIVVFELRSKTVVVELQMTTKLNFWRYLPPAAHGNTLVFMLITPVGGFHWMPLNESPRPQQAWRRGSELQGKKIIGYEEGGSNGLSGPEAGSTVALLLVSKAIADAPVEAWCLPVYGDSRAVCISRDVMGAAFFRPPEQGEGKPFTPLLITVVRNSFSDTSQLSLELRDIMSETPGGPLEFGDVKASIDIDIENFTEVSPRDIKVPTMAMGTSPAVFCCCLGGFIVVIVRRKGLVVVFEYVDSLAIKVGQKDVGQYVVDAAIRFVEGKDDVEAVLLLCAAENVKDGVVATVRISKNGTH